MGYGEAPWEFRGRALYQLSLVKVEEVWLRPQPQCASLTAAAAAFLPPLPAVPCTDALLPCVVPQARKYVPPELPLVNLFGWTLGGFYLARYSCEF